MGMYTNKGLYNSYDKNHKERDKTDYYATQPGETLNILNELNWDFINSTILEPSAGGGHMLKDIETYLSNKDSNARIIATDLHKHPVLDTTTQIVTGEQYDFLSDDYPYDSVDYIIMNPPFATIEPFTIRALEIAKKGFIMFARLQFVEGKNRYENILKDNPPTYSYVYVDRIQCWKDGQKPTGTSAQAYAWFIWDKSKTNASSQLKWIRRK